LALLSIASLSLSKAKVLEGDLWAQESAPAKDDDGIYNSSPKWNEGKKMIAKEDMRIYYGGGKVEIRAGDKYWTDDSGKILVGWHGTVSPPLGMDTLPMVNE